MARRRKGTLSEDDKTIWKKVTETAIPLDRRSVLPAPETTKAPPKPKIRAKIPAPIAVQRPAKPVKKPSTAIDRAADIADRLQSAPVRMDNSRFTQMKRGKMKPEARIDLHGMTLAQAQPALIGFIQRAASDGKRLVLVITGKGNAEEHPWPSFERRGILRQQVPHWLHSAPIGPLILQVSPAHLRHGGTGAYYVYLKRGR